MNSLELRHAFSDRYTHEWPPRADTDPPDSKQEFNPLDQPGVVDKALEQSWGC